MTPLPGPPLAIRSSPFSATAFAKTAELSRAPLATFPVPTHSLKKFHRGHLRNLATALFVKAHLFPKAFLGSLLEKLPLAHLT